MRVLHFTLGRFERCERAECHYGQPIGGAIKRLRNLGRGVRHHHGAILCASFAR